MSDPFHSKLKSGSDPDYAKKTGELYNEIADWYVRSFWDDETDDDWINVCLQLLPKESCVADIGSGPGNYARRFLEKGHRVVCIDISARMIQEVGRLLPTAVGIVADMRQLQLSDCSVDCVFCAYSLSHIKRHDLKRTIRGFVRVLRPSGLLCLFFKLGTGDYLFSASGHPNTTAVMTLFSPDEIKDTLLSAGIEVKVTLRKNAASESEFQHPKMLMVGSKIG
jgi:ubiquinone/menaquinone biosynthesis C-methylase UbiE